MIVRIVAALEVGVGLFATSGTIESGINQSLTREYLQHEANLALMKFAHKGGTATVVIPTSMQTAPLINVGGR